MYYLTLTELDKLGGPVRQLGTVRLDRERTDPVTKVESYTLKSEGACVGAIHGWRAWHGPWRLAQAALNTLYPCKLMSPAKLRDDGVCNAVTQRGRRCRVDVQRGRYFCAVHDRMR